jgi:hypothetical protein
MGYTHLMTLDDMRAAEQPGALLDREFLAQDLPGSAPDVEKASELIPEAV